MPPVVHMYSGRGTNPECLQALLAALGYAMEPVDRADLASLRQRGARLLFLPGGWYFFTDEQKAAVQDFVRQGGGCVGVCAGSYQVAGYIPVIPGRVLRANFRGRVYLEPQRDHPILSQVALPCTRHQDRRWEPVPVTHLGGPVILPSDRESIVASYDFEGELGALVAAAVGRGRAVAIASHPEHPLAPLPPVDTVTDPVPPAPAMWGDIRLILANAVRWAMNLPVDPSADAARLAAAR